MIRELNAETKALEDELTKSFELHPDAALYLSLPGLGFVLGARVIGEFGDDPNRYLDAKGRRAYSGMAPITKSSGIRHVVLARYARNRQLADACYLWAFSSLTGSAGAHQYYRVLRARGKSHHQALRALGNRWVSILHGCLRHGTLYSEAVAWTTPATAIAACHLEPWDVSPASRERGNWSGGRDNPNVSEVPALNGEGAVPSRLPARPLKSTVAFPRIFIPLSVGRKRSLQLLEDLAGVERHIAVATQLDESAAAH